MTTTTRFATTIDQHVGNHDATGLREMRLKEIITNVSDYIPTVDFEAMSASDRTEFLAELERVHDARVALESLDADHRGRASEWLDDNASDCDFDNVASLTLKAIRETESD